MMGRARVLMRRGAVIFVVATAIIAGLIILALVTDSTLLWIVLSLPGDKYLCLAVSIALTVLDAGAGALILLSVLLSGALNILLKGIFKMPRPPSELWRVPVSGYGFPSGHAQMVSAFWTALLLALRRRYGSSRPLVYSMIMLATVVIVAVCISRIKLYVHYPVDVIGGVAFGVLSAFISYILLHALRKTKLYSVIKKRFPVLFSTLNKG